MIKVFLSVLSALLFVGCPQDLDAYDDACERNHYVQDGTCQSCYDTDHSVQGINEPGDFMFDGNTECDYDIEKDIVGNYSNLTSPDFVADFEGNVSYFDFDYTIMKTDHNAHYVHLQKSNKFYSLNWRKKDRTLCLSKMWGPFDTYEEVPSDDYVTYDENVACADQPGSDWAPYTQRDAFDARVLVNASLDFEVEGNQWVTAGERIYNIPYAVDKKQWVSSEVAEWKTIIRFEQFDSGGYRYDRWDWQKRANGDIKLCESSNDTKSNLWDNIFWEGRPDSDNPTQCSSGWETVTVQTNGAN
jgi:hypothetical protein